METITPQDRQTLKALYSMLFTASKRKYPDHPLAPKPFRIRKTSQLELAVEKLFHLYGYNSVRRTHVVGRQIEPDKVYFNNITGKPQVIEKGKYIPTTGRKGEADIHGNVMLKDGRSVSLAIEIKNQYTNDRIRPEQLKYKEDFEADGGIYVVFHSITEAMQWVDEYLHKKIYY